MKIYFSRSGGFAAIELRSVIDTAQLAEEEQRQVEGLVEAAHFFDLPEKIQDGGGGADRFQFTLTIQREGQSHTVEAGEAAMPSELQALVQEVTLLARRSRGQ
jgi:hypothetical protein